MSNFNSADIAAFKDVWVFCEQREGKLMPTDFELISKGRDLADELGVNLCGLLLGGEGIESAAKELGGYGADKVLVCESPLLAVYNTDAYAKVICDVIEDLKHSLIDPQGDFVKLTSVDTDAKTVVISDEELGEIKHTPKQTLKPDIETLEKELNETNYDDDDDFGYDDKEESSKGSRKNRDRERSREREERERRIKKQKRGVSVAGSIIALIIGAAVLIAVILVVGKAAGLIGDSKDSSLDQQNQQAQVTQAADEDDGMVPVPDLIGKTEAEAQELCASVNIGMTYKGEEASTQEKGKISSQDPVQGTKVAKNSTVNYYLSKGSESVTLTDMFGQNGALAQETLESQGLTVQINKIYPDESQSSMVDIGCVLDTEPAAGTTVKAGDTVTLTISRGINYGDSVQVPDVTGMEKNDAIAKLGKFININVEMQMSTDVAEGTVISQDPIGYTDDNPVYADPDNDTITLIVSSGSQDTSSQNTEDQSSSDTTAAVANGEVWKCTQKLKTPIGYNGGLIRLELVQNVGGAPKASSVVEGQQLTFPYQLDITGAPGVAEGTLYLSEQQSDGSYQELGHYPLTFEKVE